MEILFFSSYIKANKYKSTTIYFVLLFAVITLHVWTTLEYPVLVSCVDLLTVSCFVFGWVFCLQKTNQQSPSHSIDGEHAGLRQLPQPVHQRWNIICRYIHPSPLVNVPKLITPGMRLVKDSHERCPGNLCRHHLLLFFNFFFFSFEVLHENEPKWLWNEAIYTPTRDSRAPLSPASKEKIGPHIQWWHPISNKQFRIHQLAPMPFISCHLNPTLPLLPVVIIELYWFH